MASAGTASVDIELNFDNVDSALDNAIAGLEAPPLEVPVEADLASLESDLASLEAAPIDVPVDADVAAAEAELEGLEAAPVDIPVTADTAAAQQSIDDLSGSIGALGDAAGVSGGAGAVGGLTSELGGLAGATGGVAAGLGVAVGAFGMAIDAAGDAQVVVAQTDSILASLGDSAVVTGDHIGELSTKVMEYSGFSDEAVRAGANTLLMFDNIASAEVFDRAIEGAADLAVRMGTDVPGAARLLGMALQDPEAGMSRLRRAGITLTDAQKEQVTSFMEVGDVASAQEVILASLEGRIGNLAEDYGDTMKGGMDRAREAMDELAESAGSSLLPMMEALADSVVDQTDRLQSWDDALGGALLSGPIQAIAGIGDGLEGVGTVIGDLPPGLRDTASAADEAAQAISDLSGEIDDYLGGLYDVPDAQQNMRQSFAELAEAMTTGNWDDQADAMQNVVESTAEVIDAQNQQGASQAEMDATIQSGIDALHGLESQGKLSADQVADLTREILGIPADPTSTYHAPGLNTVYTGARNYRAMMDRIDGDTVRSSFIADGLNRIYMDSVNYRAIMDDLDGRTVTTHFKNVGSVIPKNARGTESAAPGLSWVGEEGPELIALAGGERIWSHPESMAMAAAGSPTITNHYTVNVTAPRDANPREFAQAVIDAISEHERANGSGWRNN